MGYQNQNRSSGYRKPQKPWKQRWQRRWPRKEKTPLQQKSCPQCQTLMQVEDISKYNEGGGSRKIGEYQFCTSMNCNHEEGEVK